jgi:DNA-binding XRE family transcriptional regulator
MPQVSPAIESLPAAGSAALRELGADLSVARKRRKQSLREWAQRINVSVPTLIRMEKGDPTVSMGVYATALWLINRHGALAALADPKEDKSALEAEVKHATQRHQRERRG